MSDFYSNGPEGMPRVPRMTNATIGAVLARTKFAGTRLQEPEFHALLEFVHAIAEETLARVELPAASGAPAGKAREILDDLVGVVDTEIIQGGGDRERVTRAALDAMRFLVKTHPTAAGPMPGMVGMTLAAASVLAERRRQVEQENWTPERDDGYINYELGRAAATYALVASMSWVDYGVAAHRGFSGTPEKFKKFWPWSERWLKPTNRRRDLVKAGALILAEIERLDRADIAAAANHTPQGEKP
jgi:hypothetical protein